jgi:hypothetical protein
MLAKDEWNARRDIKLARDRNSAEHQRLDKALDEGLMETFPASDAVMIVQPVPERRAAPPRHRG